MKDTENKLYTMIRNHLKAAFPSLKITGISENRPAVFPTVAIEVTGRTTDRSWNTSQTTQQPDVITITITAMTAGEKQTAKDILETAEEPLMMNRFTRSGYNTPRRDDSGIVRASVTLTAGYDGDFFYNR